MSMRPTTPTPTRKQLQAVRNKLNHALHALLLDRSFFPVPGAAAHNLTHRWTRGPHVGCGACRAVGTSCHIATPHVYATTTISGAEGKDGESKPVVELIMSDCERCAFLGIDCTLDAAVIAITSVWPRSSHAETDAWAADNVILESGGFRHSGAFDARFPSKDRLMFAGSQHQLLSDIYDAVERLQSVEDLGEGDEGRASGEE